MTETLRLPKSPSLSPASWESWKRYLGMGLILNVAIWGTALLYLEFASRIYTSKSAVALPRGGEQAQVSLPGVGSATSSIQSPYNTGSADPREDYRYIATSDPVLDIAADSLNMSRGEFGSPLVSIVPNTMLMEFEFEGDTPEAAQVKLEALYAALAARLDELREFEAARKDESLQSILASSQEKLENAQQRLSNYKARSEFSTDAQVEQLSSSIEQLRREQVQTMAQLEQANANLNQLSNSLQLTPQQATEAYKLQTDPYFQQLLRDYGESSAAVVGLSSRYTSDNPALLSEKARQEEIQAALEERSQSLLNKPFAYAEQLSLYDSPSRQQLLQNLVTAQADRQGFQARVQLIDQQLARLENRLKTLTEQQSVVDELRRDVQIAEAIFTSTLTQLDLRSSDVFGSYPQIQIIEEPSLPNSPSEPKPLFVLLGATFGSTLLTLGVASLWYRNHKLPSKRVQPAYSTLMPNWIEMNRGETNSSFPTF